MFLIYIYLHNKNYNKIISLLVIITYYYVNNFNCTPPLTTIYELFNIVIVDGGVLLIFL